MITYGEYINMGGVTGTLRGARAAELLRLHRQHQAQQAQQHPPACRVCGAIDCDKPACLRSILAAEEAGAVRQRQARRAADAARDAAGRRNGHSK